MAMYYEIGVSVDSVETCVRIDSNATPVEDWKQAVDFVMAMTREYNPDLTVEFDYVKEYQITDEPKDLGFIFQPQNSQRKGELL